MEIVKWILRYLRYNSGDCLDFGGFDLILKGYIDVDMIGDLDNKKFTTGYFFYLFRERCIMTIEVAEVCHTFYN